MINHISPLVDCRTLSTINILNEDKNQFDAEELFALCGGIDLWIVKGSNRSKINIIISRNMTAEIDFLIQNGYDVEILDNIANEKLVDYIDNGYRIIVDMDRYYLQPYSEKFGSQHFGYHCANIPSYTSNNSELSFSALEFLREEPYTYSSETLTLARFSDCDMYSPKARVYIIKNTNNFKIDNEFFYYNLKKSLQAILNREYCSNSEFNSVLLLFQKVYNAKNNPILQPYAKVQSSFIRESIARSDCEGSAYRHQYANGMKKLAQRTNDIFIDDISNSWIKISNDWKQMGKRVSRKKDFSEDVEELMDFYLTITNAEKALHAELYEYLHRLC